MNTTALELDVLVHRDQEASFWGEVVQLPGCFAAGRTREELDESLKEAIVLYVQDEDPRELATWDRVESVERYRFSDADGVLPV